MANLANTQPFWTARFDNIVNKSVKSFLRIIFLIPVYKVFKHSLKGVRSILKKRNEVKAQKQIENVMVLLRTLSNTIHYKNRKIVIRNKFDDSYSKIIQKLKMNHIAYTIREDIIFIKNNESAIIKIKIIKNKIIILVNKKGITNLQYKLT